jgi:4-amino-4-deoxy-L-arabinose transferase-like glycosyltransferase
MLGFGSVATRNRDFWLLALIALLLLGSGLGLRDPWPADEPRFALVAKQMVESGQYLFPHRGGELYADKPPLFMWLQAAAFHLTGEWRIAFLLPSLLASLGILLLVYDLGRRLASQRAALIGTALLLFAVQFTYQAKRAQIDPTVVFFITLACYGLLRHLIWGPAWRWFWFGCFAAGIGTVTKGVGALALLMLLPYALARRFGMRGLAPIEPGLGRWALGVLAFIAGAAVWLAPMLIAVARSDDPAFHAYAREILFYQTAVRYAAATHHLEPWWYFLGVIASMWWPLAFAWPWAAAAWKRRLVARRDGRYLLLLGWSALIVLFFSLSAGKRDVYILPALPMMAVATIPLLPGIVRKAGFRALCLGMALVLSALASIAALLALNGEPGFEQRLELARGFDPADDAPWRMLLIIGSGGLIACALFRLRRGLAALLGTLLVLWVTWVHLGYALLNDSSSARGLMQRARELAGPGTEIGLVAWKEQNLLQAIPPVHAFGFRLDWAEQREQAFAWLAERPESRRIFSQDVALGICVRRELAMQVGRANRRLWYLYGHEAVIPGCRDASGGSTGAPSLMQGDEDEDAR